MADTLTKEKIINIKTQGAEKNVKTLKQQIRELREQMALLEKGTVEYDKASQKLANLNQKNIEIQEALKYSNKDLGATLSNLTTVATGVVGAISSINGVMSLMGADSEEAMEAMRKIQSFMAIIQGMSAIDTAIKALKGLTVAFRDYNVVRGVNAGVVAGAATSELAEAGAIADNTVKMHKNNEEAVEFNKLNREGKSDVDKSKKAIDEETQSLLQNTKLTIANKEAKKGETETAQKLIDELEKLNKVHEAEKNKGTEAARQVVLEDYQKQIRDLKDTIAEFEKSGLDTSRSEKHLSDLEYSYAKLRTTAVLTTGEIGNAWDNLELQLEQFVESGATNDIKRVESQMNDLAKAMSPEDLKKRLDEVNSDLNDAQEQLMENLEKGYGNYANTIYQEQKQALDIQKKVISENLSHQENLAFQEQYYKKQLEDTIKEENGETAALKANEAAKEDNAKATGELADKEKKLANETKKTEPLFKKLISSIKNAGNAIWTFAKANPVFATIAASAAVVAGVFALIAWQAKKSMKEMRAIVEFNNEVNHSYEEQQIRLNVLLNTARDETQTLIERKKATDELNKLIPNYNAELDETTGKYKENSNALNDYLNKLKEKIELEAYEGRIKDLLQQRLELEQKLIKVQTSGWNVLGIRVHNIKNDIKDIDKEIDKLYGKINDLYLPWALDENKVTNTVKSTAGGIKKAFQDLYKELSDLYRRVYTNITNAAELRKVFNGVYTEASVAFDKIVDAIDGNRFASKITDGFKTALKNGLKDINATDISLDMIFGDAFNELESKLNSAKDKLKGMLAETKIDEKELTKQKTYVDELEKELKTMSDIANAVLKYKQSVESTREAQEARNKANEKYNRELETTMRYMENQRRGSKYADLEREIELNTQLRNETNQRLDEEKARLAELQQSNLKNKETMQEIADLQKRIDEDEKTANEAKLNISNAKWQERLTYLDEVYDKIKRNSEIEQQALEIDRREKGGGVADYNTDVDLIKLQLQAMVKYAKRIDEFYKEKQAAYAEDSEQWLLLENERLAAQEALQDEYRKKELEKDKAQADQKLAIQQAYINTYQALSGQLSGILGEVMNYYEEDSKEYLKLKYAQGVTDTISGTISAYMSGVQSGLVPPKNIILGGVLAASTLAMGIMQLTHMKNGTLPNSPTATPVQIGSEYDTLAYAQNAEILSNIKDSKVYVLESEISNAQRRVQVQESNATF